jgi:hypothetical protein
MATFDLFGRMVHPGGGADNNAARMRPGNATTLYMRLPDEVVARLFAGFGKIAHVPRGYLSFLVGQSQEFEALFD